MSDRSAIARKAAAGLRKFAASAASTPVMVGFDGFVDSIIHVVDKRTDADHYQPVPTIERLSQKIAAASGQSSNYELVVTLEKLGGNGPIMANAMSAAGVKVSYIGALGHPAIHPVFADFARVAEVHSVSEPGYTDALEFSDGKLMLGKHGTIRQLGWEQVANVLGEERFRQIVHRSKLIGIVNWTMLTKIESVYEKLYEALAGKTDRTFVFIDLADPEKRTEADLKGALTWVTRLNDRADVIFGANLKESTQVADVLGIKVSGDPESAIEQTARAIREKLGNYAVVIHPRRGAAAAVNTPEGVVSASFKGPFVQTPRLSTGAGDNFNAGFCLGRLAGLPVEQCLCVGTATSGFYVRDASSPTLEQLADFCDNLPEPE
jgi:sugar/nucleoside kinase (ribokinase family)